MVTLKKSQLLSKKEMEVLKNHILADISYEGGGTFSKLETDEEGNYLFDKKEAEIVKKALVKIQMYLT